jgi:hypothetical protein
VDDNHHVAGKDMCKDMFGAHPVLPSRRTAIGRVRMCTPAPPLCPPGGVLELKHSVLQLSIELHGLSLSRFRMGGHSIGGDVSRHLHGAHLQWVSPQASLRQVGD